MYFRSSTDGRLEPTGYDSNLPEETIDPLLIDRFLIDPLRIDRFLIDPLLIDRFFCYRESFEKPIGTIDPLLIDRFFDRSPSDRSVFFCYRESFEKSIGTLVLFVRLLLPSSTATRGVTLFVR